MSGLSAEGGGDGTGHTAESKDGEQRARTAGTLCGVGEERRTAGAGSRSWELLGARARGKG